MTDAGQPAMSAEHFRLIRQQDLGSAHTVLDLDRHPIPPGQQEAAARRRILE
jgi:hypothetical protein